MCWLDEYYTPETGSPCADLIARIRRDADCRITPTEQERAEAAERVASKRRIRQLAALNERLLDELERLKGTA